jgi:hypothetical protein
VTTWAMVLYQYMAIGLAVGIPLVLSKGLRNAFFSATSRGVDRLNDQFGVGPPDPEQIDALNDSADEFKKNYGRPATRLVGLAMMSLMWPLMVFYWLLGRKENQP